MIKKQTPVTMAEAKDLAAVGGTENQELEAFIGKFVKISADDADKMGKELETFNILKMRKVEVIKVIDFLPEDAKDLNKIFLETSLDEDEQTKILDVVKKYQ